MTQQTSTHVVESFCGCGVPYCALLVTFTPQVILLNSVKRPKLIDLSRSPMHHRDTSTGHACPLGTPMCRLEACGSRWGAVTRGTLYALQTSGRTSTCTFSPCLKYRGSFFTVTHTLETDFFSKRIDQEKKKAALTATMKKAVTAAKIFKKHSRKISVEHR